MSPSAVIPVVCALIENQEGLVLMAQRPPHKHLGLKWEFPGGKIEPGEAAETALHREIREELGCAIELVRPLPRCVHAYEKITIEMIPFVARLTAGTSEPHPHEHVALRWVAPAELASLDLPAADGPIIEAYLASLPSPLQERAPHGQRHA
jgi:8-oxo-dGTP diphosphatase